MTTSAWARVVLGGSVGALLAVQLPLASPLPAAGAGTATVTVDPAAVTGNLPEDVLGLSLESYALVQPGTPGLEPTQGNLAALMENLGPNQHLRVGANAVDRQTFWNANGQPLPSWASFSVTPAALDRISRLSSTTGWPVELGVNLGHLDPASITNEAQAARAAFAAQPGARLEGMECGNEPNLFSGSGLRPAGYGYSQYVPDFLACANAIGTNSAVIGPNTNGGAFEPSFADNQHGRLVLLSDQQYTLRGGPGSTATLTQLLSSSSDSNEVSLATPLVSDASKVGLQIRRDETGSANGGGVHGVSDVFGSALWAIDYSLLLARLGISGFNFHGTIGQCDVNEPGITHPYYYTPLCAASAADLQSGILTAQAPYYGLLMTHLMGAGQFVGTTVSSSANLTAYAIRGSDGMVRVMLIDKDPTSNGPVSVTLNGIPDGVGDVLHLTAPTLTSQGGIAIQGAGVDRSGHFSPGAPDQVMVSGGTTALTLPSGSAALITMRAAQPTCGVPTGAVATPSGSGSVHVQWTAVGTGCSAYAVYAYSYGGAAQMVESTSTSADVSGLASGQYYTFTIINYGQGHWGSWSGWSNWALVT